MKNPACSVVCLGILLFGFAVTARATFSIVAVDPQTGEVGCAGASCISGVGRIGDPIEGLGAINSQALLNGTTQAAAHERMLAGDSPQMILDFLYSHDAGAEERQYGIVDLVRGGRSAAFTGNLAQDWKGHRTGRGFAIQGNILAGPHVVDRMEAAYLASRGLPLADRLMAALEAAAFRGADARCFQFSSRSAFIKVVRIGDGGTPFLDLAAGSQTQEPIGVLRQRYDTWKAALVSRIDPYRTTVSVNPPVRLADGRAMGYVVVVPRNHDGVKLGSGLVITASHTGGGTLGAFVESNRPGIYAAPLTSAMDIGLDAFTVSVDDGSGSGPVEIARGATCRYVALPPGR